MKYLYIFFFLFVTGFISAQNNFQRTYEILDRGQSNGSVAHLANGAFYLVNDYFDEEDDVHKVHVTKADTKGTVKWSFDYEMVGNGELSNLQTDIMAADDKGAFFSVRNPVDGLGIVVRLAADGEVLWGASVQDAEGSTFRSLQTLNTLENNFSGGAIYAGLQEEQGGDYVGSYISSLDSTGVIEWGRVLKTVDADNNPIPTLHTAMDRCLIDSTYLIAGSLDEGSDNEIYASKIDTAGQILWSRKYKFAVEDNLIVDVLDVACASDTTSAMIGTIRNESGASVSGYIMKLNREGEIEWAKPIDLPDLDRNNIANGIAADPGNNYFFSGRVYSLSGAGNNDYLGRISADGELDWSVHFPRIESIVLDLASGSSYLGGNLEATPTGAILSGTAVNPMLDNTTFPFIVKSNFDGNAFCEEEYMIGLDDSLSFTQDTLIFESIANTILDSVAVVIDTFTEYDLPNLSFDEFIYCPNEIILDTLDATTEFAIEYEWDNGDTTPMLEFTEEGEYSVTVTVDEKVCFQLCDTAVVERLEMVIAGISPNYNTWCQDSIIQLFGSATPGLPEFTYSWSNDEDTQIIEVSEFGTYGLTVSDQCGDFSTTSITISPDDIPIPPAMIDFDQSHFCLTGEYRIRLVNSTDFDNIEWSTGEIDSSAIIVDGPGEYSVTAISCWVPVTATITADEFDMPDPLQVNSLTDNGQYCDNQTFPLSVTPTGGVPPYTFEWSTTQTMEEILVSELGVYTVIVTDDCQNQETVTFDINEDLVPPPAQPDLNFELDSFCVTSVLQIDLTNPEEFTNIEWSNGAVNTESIIVSEVGEYSLTAISCFQEVSASILIEGEMVDEPLRFPNTFIPSSDAQVNTTFGPYVACPAVVSDYELKVFNRWGKLMFESNQLNLRWSGVFDGQRQPSDVYYWYCRYVGPEGEDLLEGDVTLLR